MSERAPGVWNPETTRIALASPYPNDAIGGVGDIQRNQQKYLESQGFQVRSYTPRKHIGKTDFGDTIPLGVAFSASPRIFKTAAWLSVIDPREYRKHQDLANWADILLWHEPAIDANSYMVNLLRTMHKRNPYMVTMGELHADAPRERLKKYLPVAYLSKKLNLLDVPITNTSNMKLKVEKEFPSWKFEVVENPVDINKFNPEGPTLLHINGVPLGGNRTNILYLGRLEQRKGLLYAIDSIANIVRDPAGPKNFRFVIAGSGPDSELLHKKVIKLGLGDFVVFPGIVSEEEKPSLYRTADFCFFPSYTGESFGNVLLEAMASGKPVLAGMGYSDFLVKHNENGYLLTSTDPTESAQYILKLIQGENDVSAKKFRGSMGVFARCFAENFDIEHMVNKLLVIAARVREDKARKLSSGRLTKTSKSKSDRGV